MGHEELVTKVEDNTIDVKRLFSQIGVLWKVLAVAIPATWFLATFVSRTDNTGIDLNSKFASLESRMDKMESHIDVKLKDQSDTINSIKYNQAVNQASYVKNFIAINYHLLQHDNSLKSINQKCDYYFTHFFTEHKTTANSIPTVKPVQ